MWWMMNTKLIAGTALIFALAMSLGCGGFGGGSEALSGRHPKADPSPPPPPPRPADPVEPKELVAKLPEAVGPLAFSRDGKTLVTCGLSPSKQTDTPLLLWDWTASPPVLHAKLAGHDKSVWALAFSPDGRTLASCSEDGTVRLWDTHPGQTRLRATLTWDKGRVESVSWSADGKVLACSGGEDSLGGVNWFIRLWDVSGDQPKEITTFNGGTSVALSPDGKTLASAWATEILLWDVDLKGGVTKRCSLSGHQKVINALAFSPDGKTLASVGNDQSVRLWDVAANEERVLVQDHVQQVMHVAWAPNGKLLATSGETKPARVVLRNSAAQKLEQWRVPFNDVYASNVAFSPDSRHLAFPFLTLAGERLVWVLRLTSGNQEAIASH
jgi:WD40 repeat protein